MPEGLGYDFDFMPLVTGRIPTDVASAFQLEGKASSINQPFVENVQAWFNASPEERENMERPTFAGIYTPGMEDMVIGTLGAIGYWGGDNPEVAQWQQEERQVLAREHDDPKFKHAIGLLGPQSFYAGQQKKIEDLAGPQGTPVPTPSAPAARPTPEPVDPQTGWTRREIMEALDADVITREEAAQALGRLQAPTPTPQQ